MRVCVVAVLALALLSVMLGCAQASVVEYTDVQMVESLADTMADHAAEVSQAALLELGVDADAELDVDAETAALPGLGGACGAGGRCVNAGQCDQGSGRFVIQWSLCAVPTRCCQPTKVAAKPVPAAPKPAASAAPIVLSGCTRPIGASPASIVISAEVVTLANKWTFPPGLTKRGICPAKNAMSPADVSTLVSAAWKAFGATPNQVASYTERNMRQIKRESTYCPSVVQGVKDVNWNNPAGGLFQFIPQTFNFWAVRGYTNRFNPLHNVLAAVNAQVNAVCITPPAQGRVLQGTSGWGPSKGTNPFH